MSKLTPEQIAAASQAASLRPAPVGARPLPAMSPTKAKQVAKNPEAYTTDELDDALTCIVESPAFTERQVTRLQAAIDPVLRARIGVGEGADAGYPGSYPYTSQSEGTGA